MSVMRNKGRMLKLVRYLWWYFEVHCMEKGGKSAIHLMKSHIQRVTVLHTFVDPVSLNFPPPHLSTTIKLRNICPLHTVQINSYPVRDKISRTSGFPLVAQVSGRATNCGYPTWTQVVSNHKITSDTLIFRLGQFWLIMVRWVDIIIFRIGLMTYFKKGLSK